MELVLDSFRLPEDQLAIVEESENSWVCTLLKDRQVFGLIKGKGGFNKDVLMNLDQEEIHLFDTQRTFRKLVMQQFRSNELITEPWSLGTDFGGEVEG